MASWLRWMVMAAIVGCGSTPTQRTEPQVEVREVEVHRATDVDAVELRTTMKTDPVRAMKVLGISDEDFEPIAHKLYSAWRLNHPDQQVQQPEAKRPAPEPPPPRPVAAPAGGWWCTTAHDPSDRSDVSSGCDRVITGCNDLALAFAKAYKYPFAAVDYVDACEWQEVAACGAYKNLLTDETVTSCAAKISHCENSLSFVRKKTADFKVTVKCAAKR